LYRKGSADGAKAQEIADQCFVLELLFFSPPQPRKKPQLQYSPSTPCGRILFLNPKQFPLLGLTLARTGLGLKRQEAPHSSNPISCGFGSSCMRMVVRAGRNLGENLFEPSRPEKSVFWPRLSMTACEMAIAT